MKKRNTLGVVLLMLSSASGYCIELEFGAIVGGGSSFATGSFFDSKAAALAELGASALDATGSSEGALFLGWSAGAYAEVDFIEWFGVRLEPRVCLIGGSRTALTDAAIPFDRYGVFFYGIVVPVLARGRLPLGPGIATASVGPFYAFPVSEFFVVDRYASSTTTASFTQGQLQFFGVSGGLGYSFQLGPGIVSLELRADWALSSAAIQNSSFGGEIIPLGVWLAASYGYGMEVGAK